MPDKKGLGSVLRGMLFVDESSDSTKKKPLQDEPVRADMPVFRSSALSSSSAPAFKPSVSAPARTAGVNQEMLAEVERALSERSAPAYKQFTSMLNSLAAKLPDEATRFAAALAVAPSMNLDVDVIRNSFGDRLKILDSLQADFEEQSQQELDRRVNGTKTEVARIDSNIDEVTNQIAELNSRLEDLKKSKAEKSASIAHDSASIEGVRSQMTIAFEAVRAKATTERDTVSRHTEGS